MILNVADQRWAHPGARDQHIRDQLGTTPILYEAELLAVLRDPAAEAERPQLTHRLQRIRDRRLAARSSARRYGWAG